MSKMVKTVYFGNKNHVAIPASDHTTAKNPSWMMRRVKYRTRLSDLLKPLRDFRSARMRKAEMRNSEIACNTCQTTDVAFCAGEVNFVYIKVLQCVSVPTSGVGTMIYSRFLRSRRYDYGTGAKYEGNTGEDYDRSTLKMGFRQGVDAIGEEYIRHQNESTLTQ